MSTEVQVKTKIVGKDVKGFLNKMAQDDNGMSIGVASLYHFTVHEYKDYETFSDYWLGEVEIDMLMDAINKTQEVITPKLEKFTKVKG